MSEITPEQQWTQWREQWDAAAWHFTYMDEVQPDKPVLQGGLVAVFYFVDAAQAEKRKALAQMLRGFHDRYAQHLTWGTYGPKVEQQPYTREKVMECTEWIEQADMNHAVEFTWASGGGLDFVGEYQINAFSTAFWFEKVHKTIGYLRIHLPVDELNNLGYPTWLRECAALLQPIHGLAGLGFQQCYEFNNYEALEFAHALDFSGLDVGHPLARRELRHGLKSINWLTFLADSMLVPLGGRSGLKEQTAKINRCLQIQAMRNNAPAEQLLLHFYEGGVMVQAGEWPQLGWAAHDPHPLAYVAANLLLRPARVPELGSLHLGSVVGEARFDKHTSNVWLRRFDAASDELEVALNTPVHELPAAASVSRQASVPGGEPCPKAGWWFTPAQLDSRRYFDKGEILPIIKGSSFGDTNWQQTSDPKGDK
uniref:DUF3396 domain-containing protein n=1 Tax=Variovorax paradoxus (strain S110) TaxID=543728 RepID=C5CNC4_VARPS